ncbi:histone acetyltransferase GCN5-like [Amphibalanus amphitrite]|uniref:histone acetyltransferase GCN5-like n=1 Tax=Amphibalanus amphitrite TaxID=1232801 RepID=UPI001C92922E|nr:histone acetyltransferase GCN5-like [Amphibalanus amphitrite]XP_043221956.1 histone acetyltransferase GCN5-like [Amphibalanus amphitrite]
MQTMSAAAECDSKEPYSSDTDESEEQQSPPDDVDHEEGEDGEGEEEDIGGLTEAERQEMERLNSQLDFLNMALDEFEEKNSNLQQRLLDFLSQNSSTESEKPTAAGSSSDKNEGATDSTGKS